MEQATDKKKLELTISIVLVLLISLVVYHFVNYFLFTVQIIIDGKTTDRQHHFADITVSEALHQAKIELDPDDACEPAAYTTLSEDATVEVTRAVTVNILADGVTQTIHTVPVSQPEAVQLAGITLGEKDFIENETTFPVTDGQTLHVVRVTETYDEQQRVIPYTSMQITDPNLELGITQVTQGVDGLVNETFATVYYDGQEVNRHVCATDVLTEMQPYVVAEGSATTVSRGGQTIHFRQAYQMQATGYTYSGYKTATGRDPKVGLIAVDPDVIPLGSNLYVEGYGYVTAADTGGAIQGNRIDLFFETAAECFRWGNRSVRVYLLD